MFDIITVGSATVDAFAETDRKFIREGEFCFPIGAKLLVKHIEFHTGGGGTNTGVAFSRLGLKTAFLGKIGTAENSLRILKVLNKEDVNTSLVCRGETRTGYSMIIDAKGSDRTIFAYKGSNNDLSYKEINKGKLKTKWFYFSSMMGTSHKTQEKLAEFAFRNKIKIAFNVSTYLAKKGFGYIGRILKRTEIFVLNKEEAQLLTKKNKIKEMFKLIHSKGPKIIVITDGKNGAYASDKEKTYYIKPHKVNIKETTGAGDAFAATFVAAMIKTNDIEFSLKVALANAESVITHYGAKNLLLQWSTVVNHVRRDKGKVKII